MCFLSFPGRELISLSLFCVNCPYKIEEREKERKGEEAGLGIQGQVQCKSLSLVNVERTESKQTDYSCHTLAWGDAQTHTHIHTRGEGGRENVKEGW